jgi:hypothetical protein
MARRDRGGPWRGGTLVRGEDRARPRGTRAGLQPGLRWLAGLRWLTGLAARAGQRRARERQADSGDHHRECLNPPGDPAGCPSGR